MEPISAGLAIVGLGMSIFGGIGQAHNAQQQAAVSMDIAKQEMGINAEKQKAMELNARRQQLETFRNTQRARAQATQAAVSQGASLGSGLQGGLGQIASQGLFNAQGIDDALVTGRAINTYNNSISQDKIRLAQLGGENAQNQLMSSLGGSVMKIGSTVGPMFGGFGNMFGGSSGNFSGTPGASNTGGLY